MWSVRVCGSNFPLSISLTRLSYNLPLTYTPSIYCYALRTQPRGALLELRARSSRSHSLTPRRSHLHSIVSAGGSGRSPPHSHNDSSSPSHQPTNNT
eukprot:scaffold23434_cov135-Isochrysis_galbana.AAC.14